MNPNETTPAPGPKRRAAPPVRTRDLLAGLPAIVAALAALAVAARARETPHERLVARYRLHAQRALQAGDFPAAKVCFERLLYEPKTVAEAVYGLAVTVEGLGDPNQALALLVRAAPLDRPGYPPAHLRLARTILKGPTLTPTAAAAAESHLLRVTAKGPGATPATERELLEASTLLGGLYMATGRPREALPYLSRTASTRPELRITLARAFQALNMDDNARREALQAFEELQRRLAANPDDTPARLRAAEAATITKDFAKAVEVLGQGLSRSGDARYRSSVATVYAAWADYLAQNRAPAGERVLLLERGLQVDPSNAALLERFARELKADGPEAEGVRARLRALLASGRATASVHFTLGVDAWLHDRPDVARVHFEEASRLAPDSPLILNNLAWILARGEPPDLDRALKLVTLALERQPNSPLYRGTRGIILARRKRWREALPDLEAALGRAPQDPDLHRALAETYDHLGDRTMAELHRRAAKGP